MILQRHFNVNTNVYVLALLHRFVITQAAEWRVVRTFQLLHRAVAFPPIDIDVLMSIQREEPSMTTRLLRFCEAQIIDVT